MMFGPTLTTLSMQVQCLFLVTETAILPFVNTRCLFITTVLIVVINVILV